MQNARVSARAHHDDKLAAATMLVVDQDEGVLELLATALRFQGCEVHTARSGSAAVAIAGRVRPTAVISEVALPDTDGFELLGQLRARDIGAPVVFLTARAALTDKLAGLSCGGEDYITKPFRLEEVLVRLRAILRRRAPAERHSDGGDERADRTTLTYADVELDGHTREVRRAGAPVRLSPTEFTLLHYLVENHDVVLAKTAIRDHLWPRGTDDQRRELSLVETYVSYLRRKIDTGRTPLIHTVRGRGYLLRKPTPGSDHGTSFLP